MGLVCAALVCFGGDLQGRSPVHASAGAAASLASTAGDDSKCPWLESVACLDIAPRTGTRCGSKTSFEFDYTNHCDYAVKVVTCILQTNGKWLCMPDGEMSEGVKPGATKNAYVCSSPGDYAVHAMPAEKFRRANCAYPSRPVRSER
jgi:hypothetical protein